MTITAAAIIGGIFAIAGTVLSLIFITPEKKKAQLNKFLAFIHDLFNFKYLFLEKVLKTLYILSTLFCICFGFFALFSGVRYGGYYGPSRFHSFAGVGLLVMILGPIIVRITYEGIMLFILLVKNTIQINNKLKDSSSDSDPFEAAAPAPAAEPSYAFCPKCGTRYEQGLDKCPSCGNELK